MSDPNRLLHGTDANERALLESLRADAPSDESRAAIWTAIAGQAVVASTASAATAAKVTTVVATKAIAAKVAVVVAIGALGAGAALMQRAPEPVALPAKAPERVAEVAEPVRFIAPMDTCSEAAGDGIAQGCTVSGELEPVAPPVVKPKRTRRAVEAAKVVEAPRVVEAAPVVAPPPFDALRAESQLIARARAQLRASDLAGAEQALNQARDQFPRGALGQEREVLQIELLAALGDRDGADHRARRFLRKHPDSPHAKSVQRYLITP